jgi:hypothetical protein
MAPAQCRFSRLAVNFAGIDTIGAWINRPEHRRVSALGRVSPASGQISREGETVRVEARTMRLLLCLAEHAEEVVSIDDLLEQVWTRVIVTPDSVYQAITSLRRLLGDDAKQPTYIATVWPLLAAGIAGEVTKALRQSIDSK